jgi:cytochrome P450
MNCFQLVQKCSCLHTRKIINLCNKRTLTTAKEKIELKHIPSLPFLGSLVSSQSGIKIDLNDYYSIWPRARKKFGDFYTIGLPGGLGAGINGTVHIVHEPAEMMKVLRAEGKYPTSPVQDMWSLKKMMDDSDFGRAGQILHAGEDWKLIRSFMQKDLMSPQAANSFLPSILEVVPFISKGMPGYSDNMDSFLKQASFDMFCSVLFGTFPRITDPDTVADPVDEEFCLKIAQVLSDGISMPLSPWETLLHKIGIQSKFYKKTRDDWKLTMEYGMKNISALQKRKEAGNLTQSEKNSYWNQAIERWKIGNTDLTEDEVHKICLVLFNVSVDTTSTKIGWHLMHVALNEESQETLFQEINQNVQETDGKLTPEMFDPIKSPYLGAVLRESNRLTPPVNLSPRRRIDKEVKVHGHIIPAGSVVAFDQVAKSCDPEFVDDPFEFRPERFLPEAVQARKGTKSEFLDHPLYSSPFGLGARQCPGSRVARNESMAFLAKTVLDWKMSLPDVSDFRDVPYVREAVFTPKLPTFNFESRK